jgi:hypothetical protein
MKGFTKYILTGFVLTAAMAGVVSARIQVFSQVDTSADIYVGESFTYNVIIDGENKPGRVDITPLAQYNPQSTGNRDVSKSSVTIVNGKVTKSATKRYVMSYSLTAGWAGRIQLQPVTVIINGKDYQTNPVEVNIVQPGTTDKLDLEVKLSDYECYVGQPIIITVNFYISADIGDFQFNVPPFSSNAFYVEDTDVSVRGAKQYRLSTGMHVFVSQYRVVHKGRDSILLTFSKVLIPKYPDQIQLT